MEPRYRPTLAAEERQRRLDLLLVPGTLDDPRIAGRIDRLARAFESYRDTYPLPLWAPGLIITNEMTAWTEALLPMAEIRVLFDLVLTAGCRFRPFLSGSYLHTSPTWLHLLDKLKPQLPQADPSVILHRLCQDGEARMAFLFALMLPHHFGGGFDRYPLQAQWIEGWLGENFGRLGGRIRGLDSACGSGEGTYGLAETVSAAGYGEGSMVHGSTIEPIELFAAAHVFFPHDPRRETEYRTRVEPLMREGGIELEFYPDDVGAGTGMGGYDLILCNGLLGGPLMHDAEELAGAIEALAGRLAPGGMLLAADKFHAGWRQRVPVEMLSALMRQHGLTPVEVPEGVAGKRQGEYL